MTTSANIKGTVQPFVAGNWQNKAWPYGNKKVYTVDELKPRGGGKKKRFAYGETGMLYVTNEGQMAEAYTSLVDKEKNLWKIKGGKVGHWRTVRGKRYFFPKDGSGPIPPVPGSTQTKKKGLLGKLLGKIKPGGGTSASDVFKAAAAAGAKKNAQDRKGNKGNDQVANIDAMAKKVDGMLSKIGKKGNKGTIKALKQMKKALDSGDPDAFKKANANLASAGAKMAKKSTSMKRKAKWSKKK